MVPVESTELGSERPDAAILVLCVRDEADEGGELEAQVRRVVARYADVELRLVAPAVAAQLGALAGYRAPSVLVLRDGEVVGSAMGHQLPSRELDELVHSAVSWPA